MKKMKRIYSHTFFAKISWNQTKEITKEMIWRNIFGESNFFVLPQTLCVHLLSSFLWNFCQTNMQSCNYGMEVYFDENSVKPTGLLKKLPKKWFDEISVKQHALESWNHGSLLWRKFREIEIFSLCNKSLLIFRM